jgi:hypothetical protein
MDKLVISSAEVSSVEPLPAGMEAPRLPPPLSWVARILTAILVLVLPVLCLATLIIWLCTRKKEPRVRQAWVQYCCLLLVISGLATSVAVGLAFFLAAAPAPQPSLPFALDGPAQLPESASTELLSPRELASRVENTVFIVTRDSKLLKPTRASLAYSSFGTGVLIFAGEEEFLIATSRHVLDGEKWEHSAPYKGDAVLWDRHGGFTRAQIVGRHKELDLMLLSMPRGAEKSAFVQSVLDFEQVAAGERVMVFGHPQGLFFSLSDGLVSRKESSGLIQITAPVSPGASGGPVYDLHGQLLGIVSSMLDKERSPQSENLNFAVRADSLLHPEQWDLAPAGKSALEKFISAGKTSPPNLPNPPPPQPSF